MATPIVLPKQGQSVESCIIVSWKKAEGESVAVGEILCEVETDKALLEIESPEAGTLLVHFFQEGEEVPVLTNIAVVGQPGEPVVEFRPAGASESEPEVVAVPPLEAAPVSSVPLSALGEVPASEDGKPLSISPRARNLAQQKGLDIAALKGSGPAGRIIERDVQAALAAQPTMTPLAKSMVAQGGYQAPAQGSGLGGRVVADDLLPVSTAAPAQISDQAEIEVIPLKGVRKVIASRMLESLQTTAQLTLNASADARALRAYRQRLKQSDEGLGLQKVSLNDLVLFAVSRLLAQFPEMNALFENEAIARYKNSHLGFAVDTPRGLLVPVIRQANQLSLKQISAEARRLATAALEGSITSDEMQGGTFTVTNLGSFGIESFTPVLNPPQVAILGVGNINLKPVEVGDEVEFIPHIGLSLTINHQVVDGAPAARFLQALGQGLAGFEMLLAL